MKLHWSQQLLALSLGLSLFSVGEATTATTSAYTFRKIADTSGEFSGFRYPPAINATGTVAFQAFLDTGGEGIFIFKNGVTTKIADTNGPFSSFAFPLPSINKVLLSLMLF